MNAHFVNIKVDREERPDVDAVYMEATQALTGHGGWPMTCFLTPDGEPFYAGTYFPPRRAHGMPSFPQVLDRGRARPGDDDAARSTTAARGIAERLARPGRSATSPTRRRPTPSDLDAAVARARRPVRPRRTAASAARRSSRRRWCWSSCCAITRAPATDGRAARWSSGTCEAMARGGMYDQLAGGFARYSVDAGWVVPHFEKMLYDNALLLRVYAHWWRATGVAAGRAGRPRDRRVPAARPAHGRGRVRLRARRRHRRRRGPDLRLDARRSWSTCSGADDGAWAAALLAVTAAGTFEHGASTLQLPADPDDADALGAASGPGCSRRGPSGRSRPATTRWSRRGTGWRSRRSPRRARCSTSRPGRRRARRAPSCSLACTWSTGRRPAAPGLARRRRRARTPACSRTTADVAEGLLALYSATGDARWLQQRRRAARRRCSTHFRDGDGGFFDTADDAEAAAAAAAGPDRQRDAVRARRRRPGAAVVRRAHRVGPAPRGRRGGARLSTRRWRGSYPRFAGWGLAVAEAALDGPREVAVVGDAGRSRLPAAAAPTARRGTAPGAGARRSARPGRAGVSRCSPTGRCVDGPAGGVRLPPLRLRRARRPEPAALAAAVSARGEQRLDSLASAT